MQIDLMPYFKKYEALVKMAEDAFNKVREQFPGEVRCKTKCSECCHALFDLSLIEALFLNHQFERHFSGSEKEKILEKANKADRKIYKLKRKAAQDLSRGKNEVDILTEMALNKVRCPLLNGNEHCDLYVYRPITCRLYGIPTAINGISHTCGQSGFKEGDQYPTVKLDLIQQKLHTLSSGLVRDIKSKHSQMGGLLVPVSMALLTTYDEAYLGIELEKK